MPRMYSPLRRYSLGSHLPFDSSEPRRTNIKPRHYDDLVRRVQNAAAEIGITDTTVLMSASDWDFCFSYLRETQFCSSTTLPQNSQKDLGYFNEGHFEYNLWVFSERRLDQFLKALRKRGVSVKQHNPLSTIHYSEREVKRAENREKLAIYK